MGLGGQEALGGLEVPSLQGCPQLQPGQGSLGGPADLQWNQGVWWVCKRQGGPGWPRDEAARGSRYEMAPEATGQTPSLAVCEGDEHSPPLGLQDSGHLVCDRCLADADFQNVLASLF